MARFQARSVAIELIEVLEPMGILTSMATQIPLECPGLCFTWKVFAPRSRNWVD